MESTLGLESDVQDMNDVPRLSVVKGSMLGDARSHGNSRSAPSPASIR